MVRANILLTSKKPTALENTETTDQAARLRKLTIADTT